MRTEIGGEYLTNSLYNILKIKQEVKGYYLNYDKLRDSFKIWSTMVNIYVVFKKILIFKIKIIGNN